MTLEEQIKEMIRLLEAGKTVEEIKQLYGSCKHCGGVLDLDGLCLDPNCKGYVAVQYMSKTYGVTKSVAGWQRLCKKKSPSVTNSGL